jgi:hypothetical protein
MSSLSLEGIVTTLIEKLGEDTAVLSFVHQSHTCGGLSPRKYILHDIHRINNRIAIDNDASWRMRLRTGDAHANNFSVMP